MGGNEYGIYYGPGENTNQGGGYGSGGDWIAALINTGAGLYDSYQNRKTSRENVDKTIAAQKSESELAYQRSLEMWGKQNLYNSPEAQMQRFIEGGLNPNLIYGQGNAGNASGFPQYQPANLQYDYKAPNYGASIQSMLPTMMAVGTWIQDMRLKQMQVRTVELQQSKAEQLIDYLSQKNPRAISEIDNRLSLYPYQRSAQKSLAENAWRSVADLEQEYKMKWGAPLFDTSGFFESTQDYGGQSTGMRKLQFIEQASKNRLLGYEEKLKEAQSSWTDFDITNPQQLMQMVLGGVMGLAGQTLRLSTHKRPQTISEVEEKLRNGRTKTRRTIRR